MKKVEKLRKKYPVFEYSGYQWEITGHDLWVWWEMRAGEIVYHPELTIFEASEGVGRLPKGEMDNLVFHLGLADIFSYWKATCSPVIKVSAGGLDEYQIDWWRDLLIKGMGQYFYTNKIDFRGEDFVKVEMKNSDGTQMNSDSRISQKNQNSGNLAHRVASEYNLGKVLVPVGGGKDSAVTLELLSRHFGKENVGAMAMNLARSQDILPAAQRLVETAGVKELIRVRRQLDPQIYEMKDKGYLDGHVPFTAYLSFLSVFVARLFGFSSVAFSNERSSNEGNLGYLGVTINHQYSKSFEFEKKFRDYNLKCLSNISYLSVLKPFYELQIMKLFSRADMGKYWSQFRSCNVGYKNGSWCGSCSKCLAVYVGLFPFLGAEQLVMIFGKDLLEDEKLLPLAKNVLGMGDGKPFECVGTFEETVVAFNLCLKKIEDRRLKIGVGGRKLRGDDIPILLEYFQREVLPKYPQLEKLERKILQGWDKKNFLSRELKRLLSESYGFDK